MNTGYQALSASALSSTWIGPQSCIWSFRWRRGATTRRAAATEPGLTLPGSVADRPRLQRHGECRRQKRCSSQQRGNPSQFLGCRLAFGGQAVRRRRSQTPPVGRRSGSCRARRRSPRGSCRAAVWTRLGFAPLQFAPALGLLLPFSLPALRLKQKTKHAEPWC